jgi:hypothetical protein
MAIAPVNSFSKPLLNGHDGHMSPDSHLERIQIIDDEKKFTYGLNSYTQAITNRMIYLYSAELGAQIHRWGLRDAGFGYNIVAVFGSQSTGKSQ